MLAMLATLAVLLTAALAAALGFAFKEGGTAPAHIGAAWVTWDTSSVITSPEFPCESSSLKSPPGSESASRRAVAAYGLTLIPV